MPPFSQGHLHLIPAPSPSCLCKRKVRLKCSLGHAFHSPASGTGLAAQLSWYIRCLPFQIQPPNPSHLNHQTSPLSTTRFCWGPRLDLFGAMLPWPQTVISYPQVRPPLPLSASFPPDPQTHTHTYTPLGISCQVTP